jgi:glycogen debranching enzyme GlgX
MARMSLNRSRTWSWSHRDERTPVWPGRHQFLGARWTSEATNFAVWSPEATALWVCLFDDKGNETQHQLTEHTLGVWHGAIPDVPVGQLYGLRADGPWDPSHGLRFNRDKLLLDPYARAVTGTVTQGPEVLGYDVADPDLRSSLDSAPAMPRCVVTHDDDFDWEGDTQLRTRWRDTVIYELHVKGFTELHNEIPEDLRGTYAGLGSPTVTRYLQDLGVTAVELLPVQHYITEPEVADRGLVNYWGYNTIAFLAPEASYAAGGERGQQITEFKQMVKNFHAAGIEVILDVVYNHTAEGGPLGPTYSFRGLDDRGMYKRSGAGHDAYWDVTGCGNTVDATNLGALRLVMDSLRYWVTEMHVDGFRFDLASALARTGHEVDMRSAFLTTINQDPVLRHVKLVAEPWDASMDGYPVGSFPPPWVEWNDRYRDTVRDFWRGQGSVRDLASRLAGSGDLYADDGRSPYTSVNFVTAHDGFTLRDLVSYNDKHNEANGEGNRDGSNDNRSWNHGVEGETDDPEIAALRQRQAANLMATLCLSSGSPMLTAGDERGRTQGGSNNAYCQDNEISLVDWRPDNAWLDLYDLTKTALRLRREHPALRQRHHFVGAPTIEGGPKDLAWIHAEGREMTDQDWYDADLHVLGMFVSGDPLRSPGPRGEQQWDASFLIWFNNGPDDAAITLPENQWVNHGEVVLSTDTGNPTGSPVAAGDALTLQGRSVLVLRQTR